MERHTFQNAQEALQITWWGFATNLVLAAIKAVAGVISGSAALLADAGHSLSDLLSDGVTLWAIRMARLPKDANHPYGHGKFETVGALFVAILLVLTGVGIGAAAFDHVEHVVVPTKIALWVAILSIIFKEVLYHITAYIGRRTKSRILLANAWHHRSDAISSVVALIGIGGAQLGYPVLDPIAGVVVAGWIVKTGIMIGHDSVKELTDETVEQEILKTIDDSLQNIEGVEEYHEVRARRMGPYMLVDLHIQVNAKTSVSVAHQVAERVRMTILHAHSSVNEVLVHVDAEEDLDQENPKLMRPQADIEADIRQQLASMTEIQGIAHILCHYLKEQLTVQIEVIVDPNRHVYEVQAIAKRARLLVEQIPDVYSADIHLELDDH